MKTAVFYASTMGNTEDAAKRIAEKLDIPTFNIASDGVDFMNEYEGLLIGSSTWGNGELSDDWQDAWDSFCGLDLSGKTVALFGLGDQEGYDEEYLDAMGTIYDQVVSSGATVVGEWEVSDEYTHSESKAVRDGKFVGLALDEDNQDDLSDERIEKWCDQIKGSVL